MTPLPTTDALARVISASASKWCDIEPIPVGDLHRTVARAVQALYEPVVAALVKERDEALRRIGEEHTRVFDALNAEVAALKALLAEWRAHGRHVTDGGGYLQECHYCRDMERRVDAAINPTPREEERK